MRDALGWIEEQEPALCRRIAAWAEISSGTFDRDGIHELGESVEALAAPLCDRVERVPLAPFETVDDDGTRVSTPLGDAWIYRRRPDAARQVLLAVHLDTVFGVDHPFRAVTGPVTDDPELPGRRILRGPGVCDAKGGLALLWAALEAFERERPDDATGWTVLLNPDEEIGSPGSAPLLAAEAQDADFGLVFEPALPDGALAGARKGSGNFQLVARGRAAHVGRAFDEGRSAIHTLAALVHRLAVYGAETPGVIANVGFLRGGGAVNVVADFAIARCNVGVDDAEAQTRVETLLAAWCAEAGARDGVEVELHGGFASPPKPLAPGARQILDALTRCAEPLGIAIETRDTGGVCDGNKLAAAGLPNVDTMGPVGGNIHSEREYLDLDSLVPRAQLVASLLLGFARGSLELPRRQRKR